MIRLCVCSVHPECLFMFVHIHDVELGNVVQSLYLLGECDADQFDTNCQDITI